MRPSQYAPVLIPTLCRYEHFKNCVESLAKNSGADQTDLFIALDYPLKEAHWEGYNQICFYLESVSGFKSVAIIKREVNYGPSRNIQEARQLILQQVDRVIFSEDDNIFSPNFLEYVNKGLDLFEHDQSVYAICGYKPDLEEELLYDGSNFFLQNVIFSAWGYGIWRDRIEELRSNMDKHYFRKVFLNPFKSIPVLYHSSYSFLFLTLKAMRAKIPNSDNIISLYLYLSKKNVVNPVVSKVRNMGWDGSGEHCAAGDQVYQKYINVEIDRSTQFVYEGQGTEEYKANYRALRNDLRKYMSFFGTFIMFFKIVHNHIGFHSRKS